MTTKVYTFLGWLAWQGLRVVTRRKMQQKGVKLGAAATVGLVLAAGVLAAKAGSSDD
jgi:hypothetical protein